MNSYSVSEGNEDYSLGAICLVLKPPDSVGADSSGDFGGGTKECGLTKARTQPPNYCNGVKTTGITVDLLITEYMLIDEAILPVVRVFQPTVDSEQCTLFLIPDHKTLRESLCKAQIMQKIYTVAHSGCYIRCQERKMSSKYRQSQQSLIKCTKGYEEVYELTRATLCYAMPSAK